MNLDAFDFGRDNVTIHDSTSFSVKYPKGSSSNSYAKQRKAPVGGFQCRQPFTPSSSRTVFKYKVYFDEGFDWVKGGKLPGLGLGSGSTGGDHSDTGGSIRLMWRRRGKADVYLYYPEMDDEYGESNYCGEFIRGQDNQVEIVYEDGRIEVTINKDSIKLERDFKAPVTEILWSTFFGGHDKSWAAKKDEVIKFKDILIQ